MKRDIYNDNTYLNNNPTWHEEGASFKTDKIIQLLNINNICFENICEVGCGSGEILVQLAANYNKVEEFYGFDISKDAINIAKSKETNRIKFECKDVAKVKEENFFDLLLVIDVIEHVDDYFKFLDNITLLGKYTIFHIPLDMFVWSLFREGILIEFKNRVGHIHNFTEEFIESILIDKGFKIIDKIYTEPIGATKSFKQKFISITRKTLFKVHKKFCTKTIGGYSLLFLTENNAQ